jgi:hypothetical protein
MRYLFKPFPRGLEGPSQGSLLWNSHALGLTGSPALGRPKSHDTWKCRGSSKSHLIAGQVICHGGQIPSISADPSTLALRDGQFHSNWRTSTTRVLGESGGGAR